MIQWSVKKFINKAEAEEFSNSPKMDLLIKELEGIQQSLYDKALTESSIVISQGGPEETPSGYEAGYVGLEIGRLICLRDYFRKVPPNEGFVYDYNDNSHTVTQRIDLKSISQNHPEFKKFIGDRKLNTEKLNRAYEVWTNQVTNPTLGGLFKLTYHFIFDDMIPKQSELTKIIRK